MRAHRQITALALAVLAADPALAAQPPAPGAATAGQPAEPEAAALAPAPSPAVSAPRAAAADAPALSTTASAPGAASAAALAPAPSPAVSAPAHPVAVSPPPQAPPQSNACHEHLPEGKERPNTSETFPTRALSGHSATLIVEVRHGEGERVLPGGLKLQNESDTRTAVEQAGFLLPRPRGLAQPTVERVPGATEYVTKVSIPVVPLPKEPGRSELTLPPLPIAMTRASGEIITFCTQPHTLVVEDPIANAPNAEPQGNVPPRRQKERWEALRLGVYAALGGLAFAALLLVLFRLWSRRARPLPPPPPPRPAWEVALEELHDIRYAQLLEQGRLEDHFDRVTNTLRKYLGGRFGFDGLESTSREILERVPAEAELPAGIRASIDGFLEESDLVKFADIEPTEAQCRGGWERAKEIVDRTRPTVTEPSRRPAQEAK